jgi:hypothetical protein
MAAVTQITVFRPCVWRFADSGEICNSPHTGSIHCSLKQMTKVIAQEWGRN